MKRKFLVIALIAALFVSCATFQPQYQQQYKPFQTDQDVELEHSFFFAGGLNDAVSTNNPVTEQLLNQLEEAGENTTLLLLGDNLTENKALETEKNPSLEDPLFLEELNNLNARSILLPGKSEWGGIDGAKEVRAIEKFIDSRLGKNSFLPERGCPIENIHLTETIELILLDSQWYLNDWDKFPNLNDNCEIKTRKALMDEYSSLIKKNRGKTTIVALHHPIFSNGYYGGQYSIKDHMTPLPIVGSIKTAVRKTGGVLQTDLQNERYRKFRKRLITLSQENKKVVFLSGHENSLQHIYQDNLN
ncbi:MAG: metallophosphoesterase, partial [Nonlabens sp.]